MDRDYAKYSGVNRPQNAAGKSLKSRSGMKNYILIVEILYNPARKSYKISKSKTQG